MERERTAGVEVEGLPPPKSLEAILEEMKSRRIDELESTIAWQQYNPWQREKPRKRRSLNNASISIWVFARKMIAREMRRAKGIKPKRDPELVAMERYAQDWERRKAEEKIRVQRAEEERQRRPRDAKWY